MVKADVVVRRPDPALSDGLVAVVLGADPERELVLLRGPGHLLERAVARLAEADPGMSVLERGAATALVRARGPRVAVPAAAAAAGCAVLWPAVVRGGVERWTVAAGGRDHLRDLVRRLGASLETGIESVSDLSGDALGATVPLADLTGDLTPRQLDVLRETVERGYYESPRRVTSEDLARSFGVSRSTFEEHLRKAEVRVLSRFAQALRAHEANAGAPDAEAPAVGKA